MSSFYQQMVDSNEEYDRITEDMERDEREQKEWKKLHMDKGFDFLKNLVPYLPMLMPVAGVQLKARDSDNKGADDAIGDILIAAGTAFTGVDNHSDAAVDRAMLAIYNTSRSYLESKGKLPG